MTEWTRCENDRLPVHSERPDDRLTFIVRPHSRHTRIGQTEINQIFLEKLQKMDEFGENLLRTETTQEAAHRFTKGVSDSGINIFFINIHNHAVLHQARRWWLRDRDDEICPQPPAPRYKTVTQKTSTSNQISQKPKVSKIAYTKKTRRRLVSKWHVRVEFLIEFLTLTKISKIRCLKIFRVVERERVQLCTT